MGVPPRGGGKINYPNNIEFLGVSQDNRSRTIPYKRLGKVIYSKATGRFKVKQRCKSVASAKRALRLLRGLEAGTLKKRK